MRSEQINNLRKGDTQILFEFVNNYKDDVASIITALHINKKNFKSEFKQLCTNAIISVLKDLKNAPSGLEFRTWLLKTIYKKEISKATQNDKKKNQKTWKSFSVFKTEVEKDKIIEKSGDLPADQRLAIWASCHENMNVDDAARFFDLETDEYTDTLMQAMQGVRNRFPSKTKKVPDNVNFASLVQNVYTQLSPAEKLSFEEDIQNHKVKNKFYESLKDEKKYFSNTYHNSLPAKELLTNIRANRSFAKNRILPYAFISVEILIFVFIISMIIYISNQVKPPEISVLVDDGEVTLIAKSENPSPEVLKKSESFSAKPEFTKLHTGDVLETRDFSSATLSIDDINSLQLGSNAKVEILEPTSKYPITLRIERGLAWIDIVNSQEKTKFVTKNAEFVTNGGEFIFEINETSEKVLVFDGQIEVLDAQDTDSSQFSKNKAFIVDANKQISPFKTVFTIDVQNEDQYYFSIDDAKKFYFDDNGKFKVLFHWLNVRNYPFTSASNPGFVIQKLDDFFTKYASFNDKLVKLRKAQNAARQDIERKYTNIKKLEKRYNVLIKESEIILINQAELAELYSEFQKVKNTCAILRNSGFDNFAFNDFIHEQKHIFFKENEKWLAEIKKMRDASLQLSTFTAIKEGLEADITANKKDKGDLERSIVKLTSEFSSAQSKVEEIAQSKIDKQKAIIELEILNEQLVKLNEKKSTNQAQLDKFNDELKSVNQLITTVENINKQIDDFNKSLKDSMAELVVLNTKLAQLNKDIDAESAKIGTTEKALTKLQEDKTKYDEELSTIEEDLSKVTELFNAGLTNRGETTDKVNKLNKQKALIDIKINAINTDIEKNDQEIAKKETLINTQTKVIERFQKQIDDLDAEIVALQKTIDDNQKKIDLNEKEISKLENSDTPDDETAKLKETLDRYTKQMEILAKTLENSKTKRDELSAELDNLKVELDQITKTAEDQKIVVAELEAKKLAISEDLKTKNALKTDQEKILKTLKEDKAAREKDIAATKSENNEHTKKVASLNEELKSSKLKITAMLIAKSLPSLKDLRNLSEVLRSKDLLAKKTAENLTEIANLEKEIITINDDIEKSEKSLKTVEGAILESSASMDKINDEITENERILKVRNSELKNAQEKSNAAKDEIEKLESEISDNESAIKVFNRSIADAQAKLVKIETENKDKSKKIEELKAENAKLSDEIAKTKEEIDPKNTLKTSVEKKLEKFVEVKAKTESDLAELKKSRETLNENVKSLVDDQKKYLDELEKLNETLKTQKDQIFQYQTKLNELKNKKAEILKLSTPLNTKFATLESTLKLAKENLTKLADQKKEAENAVTITNKTIKELEASINQQKKILAENKPIDDLMANKENLSSTINNTVSEKDKIYTQIANTNKKIEENNKTITHADDLAKTVDTANDNLKNAEAKLATEKTKLGECVKKLDANKLKLTEMQRRISELEKTVEEMNTYKEYSNFWTQLYNEVIKNDSAMHLNAFKYDELEKRIKDLELEVGEDVYRNKLLEINRIKSILNNLIRQYKVEDEKYWYVIQVLKSAEGSEPGSITNNIQQLIDKTAEEFLPLLHDYQDFEIDSETKIKIIAEALAIYPEYKKLSATTLNNERIMQINNTWRLKLLKIFEGNNQAEYLDTLTKEKLLVDR